MRPTLLERASRSFMEKINGDIREKIVEASESTVRTERATIRVSSLEDLTKISEETFKPIIHHDDVFYILDGDMRYEFTIEKIARAKPTPIIDLIPNRETSSG